MAGDWIKMRVNLVTHPKVLAIAEHLARHPDYQEWSTMSGFVPAPGGTQEAVDRDFHASLRVTRYVTVASLLRFWGYANEHARDEFIATLRVTDIDDIVQVPGFGAALEAVGWVAYDVERKGVVLPNFNEFNTSGRERSARAMSAAERQKAYRERQKAAKRDVTSDVTSDVTALQESDRREEKRRINTPQPPKGADVPGFAAFWAAWPTSDRKQAKGKCLEAWKKAGAEPQAALVVAHVERMKASSEWLRDGGRYIPAPLVYLNQRRWEGVEEVVQAPSGRLPGEV